MFDHFNMLGCLVYFLLTCSSSFTFDNSGELIRLHKTKHVLKGVYQVEKSLTTEENLPWMQKKRAVNNLLQSSLQVASRKTKPAPGIVLPSKVEYLHLNDITTVQLNVSIPFMKINGRIFKAPFICMFERATVAEDMRENRLELTDFLFAERQACRRCLISYLPLRGNSSSDKRHLVEIDCVRPFYHDITILKRKSLYKLDSIRNSELLPTTSFLPSQYGAYGRGIKDPLTHSKITYYHTKNMENDYFTHLRHFETFWDISQQKSNFVVSSETIINVTLSFSTHVSWGGCYGAFVGPFYHSDCGDSCTSEASLPRILSKTNFPLNYTHTQGSDGKAETYFSFRYSTIKSKWTGRQSSYLTVTESLPDNKITLQGKLTIMAPSEVREQDILSAIKVHGTLPESKTVFQGETKKLDKRQLATDTFVTYDGATRSTSYWWKFPLNITESKDAYSLVYEISEANETLINIILSDSIKMLIEVCFTCNAQNFSSTCRDNCIEFYQPVHAPAHLLAISTKQQEILIFLLTICVSLICVLEFIIIVYIYCESKILKACQEYISEDQKEKRRIRQARKKFHEIMRQMHSTRSPSPTERVLYISFAAANKTLVLSHIIPYLQHYLPDWTIKSRDDIPGGHIETAAIPAFISQSHKTLVFFSSDYTEEPRALRWEFPLCMSSSTQDNKPMIVCCLSDCFLGEEFAVPHHVNMSDYTRLQDALDEIISLI